MSKKEKITIAVMSVLIVLLLAVVIGLIVYEYVSFGTLSKNSIMRSLLIFASISVVVIKLVTDRRNRARSVAFPYRDKYAEVLGDAFSEDKRLEKQLFEALAAFRNKNFAKAIKLLNALFPYAKNNGERFVILFFSARCYYFGGYYETAVKLYEKAYELKESSAVASNLGLCYDHLGDFEKGTSWLKTAISLEPENAYAYNNVSHVYIVKGDYEKGLEYALLAVEKKMNFEEALCNAAVCYAMLNDKENHQKYLRLAVANGTDKDAITEYLNSLDAPVLQ